LADDTLTRRRFLKGTGSVAGSSVVRLSLPGLAALSEAARSARDDGEGFETLSKREAIELEAMAARILPTTDTPGAREAGVVYFMDKALGSFMSAEFESIRRGLGEFLSGVSASFPGMKTFSQLTEDEQDVYLRLRDRSHFFNRVHFMTIAGFFCMGPHGGNHDEIGWQLIGFDGSRGAWQPPYGYYDAEYKEAQRDGG
jgi:gluconate 2-dehydrogenase gamma chain